jgi:hypothetical protein
MSDGVNADLWRTNRRRWKISFGLLALSVLLGLYLGVARLEGLVKAVLVSAASLAFLAGVVGLHWARREFSFLRRSESEDLRGTGKSR